MAMKISWKWMEEDAKGNPEWEDWLPTLVSSLASVVANVLARGNSKYLVPSFETRAKNHVDAGAEWSRIYRRAKYHRQKLQTDTARVTDEEAERVYFELLDNYKAASKCTVIDESVYKEFNTVELVLNKEKMMRQQLGKYLRHLEAVERLPLRRPPLRRQERL